MVKEKQTKVPIDLEQVTPAKRKAVQKMIHTASVGAGVASAVPIPFADAVILVPIQTTMVAKLYRLYDVPMSKGAVSTLMQGTVITNLGRSVSGNLLKLVPGAGSVMGATINAGTAMALTEAIGWATVLELERGQSILNDVLGFTAIAQQILKQTAKK